MTVTLKAVKLPVLDNVHGIGYVLVARIDELLVDGFSESQYRCAYLAQNSSPAAFARSRTDFTGAVGWE